MAVIGWDETKPAGQDSLGLGDDEIRSLKTALRTGLGVEHVWPSTGGDAGVHLLGSARAFVGAQSLISSAGTDGRLMVASDTSRFFHVGSGGTMFLGAANSLSIGSVLPQRGIWVEECGVGQIKSTVTLIVLPNSGFSDVNNMYVFLTPLQYVTIQGDIPGFLFVDAGVAFTATSFAVDSRDATGTRVSNMTFFWRAIGTRIL